MNTQIPDDLRFLGEESGSSYRSQVADGIGKLRKRALLMGVMLVAFLTVGAAEVEILLRSSYMSVNASTVGAFVLLFVVVGALNVLLKLGSRPREATLMALIACALFLGYYWPFADFDPRSPHHLFCGMLVALAMVNLFNVGRARDLILNRSELVVVYFMLLVASAVCTMGLSTPLVSLLPSPYYFASRDNLWAQKLFPLFPDRRLFVDDGLENVSFYEGLEAGTDGPPYSAWVEPLAWWGIFVLALCVTLICLMVIVRRQWMEHERLPYPVAQVPMALIGGEHRGRLANDFFRSGTMWFGCAIPLVVGSMQAMRWYDPSLPMIRTAWTFEFFGTEILPCQFNFLLLGFSYLINTQIAASIWIFHLLYRIESLLLPASGFQSVGDGGTGSLVELQGGGAFLVMAAAGLWLAREHLRGALVAVWGGGERPAVGSEIISYRAAVLGAVGGSVVMIGWLWLMGTPAIFAVLVVLLGILLLFGIARYVSETGLVLARSPVDAQGVLLQCSGNGLLGPSGVLGIYLTGICWQTFLMTTCATGLKLVSEVHENNRRQVFRALLLALVVGLGAGVYMMIHLAYRYGGVNLHGNMFINAPKYLFNDVLLYGSPVGPNPLGIGFLVAGAGAMLMLIWARMHISWWTLNPLGFPLSMTLGSAWFSVFLAWLAKRLILRYGGASAYRRLQPFFLGMIAGQCLCMALWVTIGTFTGQTQVTPFRF